MNCIVVDDDIIARELVKNCIEKTKFLNFVADFSTAAEAAQIMYKQKVDLIFLDIEMPEMSGIDFVKTLKNIPQIIFITGKKEYAVEAFDNDVTDYILKPIDYPRFLKAALKAKTINENITVPDGNNEDLFIKKDSELVKVNTKEIKWIVALADYVCIHTGTERYTILSTMKSIESKLPSSEFIRIHRSYIIRLDKIKTIEKNTVFIGNEKIPISRFYRTGLFDRLNLL